MAWRSYVDPTTNEWWTTDDAGNFLPGNYADQWNPAAQKQNAGPSPSAGPGFQTGQGYGYLPLELQAQQQAAQQQYQRDRLNLLEIPMSQAERAQALAQLSGYYSIGGANGAPMGEEQILDAIWKARPDFATFYKANGWQVDTPEQQRAAVQNWMQGSAPGKSTAQVAQDLGIASTGAGGWEGAGSGQPGATPTLAREQWKTASDFAREQWNTANNQWTAGFLGSKSGPRDYATYQQLQPNAAFGGVQGGPSWEKALVNFWNGSQTAPQGTYTQPTALQRPNQMSPTQRAMKESEWSYSGLDPQDMWEQVRKAQPTGYANQNLNWGM